MNVIIYWPYNENLLLTLWYILQLVTVAINDLKYINFMY